MTAASFAQQAPSLTIADGIRRLRHEGVSRLMLEAIGIVNPRRIKAFRETEGRRAKTDRLDARLIARFALVMIDEIRPLSSAEQQALKALSPVDRDGRDREDAAQAGGRAHAVGKPPHPLLDEVCERIRRDAGSVLPAHATLVTQMAR
jgi:transposase